MGHCGRYFTHIASILLKQVMAFSLLRNNRYTCLLTFSGMLFHGIQKPWSFPYYPSTILIAIVQRGKNL
jgi:hypothetical protein